MDDRLWHHRTTERSIEITESREVASEFGRCGQREKDLASAAIGTDLFSSKIDNGALINWLTF